LGEITERKFMPKKILLADDSITIQKVVELTFSDGDYEVTAVNNGAKAINKLGEMRPDIILSDIIMPEKNGYEVCEFVKSHPDYRSIPVILLTGTFEPFDPDRADKAGCDAVVTKPFESQSLIHKVDELIEQSRAAAPTAPSPAAAAPQTTGPTSAWVDDQAPTAKTPSPFAAPPPAAPTADPFSHAEEIFKAPPSDSQMSTQQIPSTPAAPIEETRAFPKMTFDRPMPAPPPPEPMDESPFGAPPPADMFSGETRAIPKMNFDDLQKLANAPAPTPPPPSPMPEASSPAPWDEKPSAFSGETRAFPKMSFDDLDKAASSAPPAPAGSSLWDEPAAATPAWSPAPEPAAAAPMSEPIPEPPVWTPPAPATAPSQAAASATGGNLTEEQINRIARRVIQLMSDQVVRNIAWEVIPDLAEMVVKERIRQLEAE
jgi:CheY-like chemotaxis protein